VQVVLDVPGLHNVYNALATLAVAQSQGVDLQRAAEVLSHFRGVGRRFEVKGEANGIIVIDDYAHHPTEIKATLAAARTRFGQRPIWVVFQPHTFSRTISLFDDFLGAFGDADHVIVVDIYASREQNDGLISSRDLVNQMTHPDVRYIGPLSDAVEYLLERLAPPAALITLGAGDGDLVGEQVLEKLGDLNGKG
jgi:UDP-N-acetylmuramate--alanine ligase